MFPPVEFGLRAVKTKTDSSAEITAAYSLYFVLIFSPRLSINTRIGFFTISFPFVQCCILIFKSCKTIGFGLDIAEAWYLLYAVMALSNCLSKCNACPKK